MKLSLYWVDAFTDKVFHGNPAAVVPLETWLPDEVMQRIAFEHGLSETAFFVRTGPDRFHLRWFTPAIEMDLCGHATLASAFALFHHLGQTGNLITFESRSGPLSVRRLSSLPSDLSALASASAEAAAKEGRPLTVMNRDGLLELDFPSRPAETAGAPEMLVRALGRAPESVRRTKTSWLVVYPLAVHVLGLQPDHALLGQVTPGRIIVTAPGDDCDFVSRFFAPEVGIPEDPVTGGAHTTLTPYWAARLGKTRLHARQVSARGGELFCELRGDRVGIAGRAVLYLRGEINI
jgi:predicted PhzF superfamily epimerase YddE/YHI9